MFYYNIHLYIRPITLNHIIAQWYIVPLFKPRDSYQNNMKITAVLAA
jgi:hypothetical protein